MEGQPLNAVAYGTLTGHLVRALNALGLKREPVDVTPALHQYLVPTRRASLWPRRSSATPWVSSPPTGLRAKVFRKRWTFFPSRSHETISPGTRPTWSILPLYTLIPIDETAYLKMYGNICYDTRDRYVNFPWSSEQK